MEMKVKGRRKRGTHKRRWLDRVKGGRKETGLSGEDVYDSGRLHGGVCHRASTPHTIYYCEYDEDKIR